jgi:hypothetical protein
MTTAAASAPVVPQDVAARLVLAVRRGPRVLLVPAAVAAGAAPEWQVRRGWPALPAPRVRPVRRAPLVQRALTVARSTLALTQRTPRKVISKSGRRSEVRGASMRPRSTHETKWGQRTGRSREARYPGAIPSPSSSRGLADAGAPAPRANGAPEPTPPRARGLSITLRERTRPVTATCPARKGAGRRLRIAMGTRPAFTNRAGRSLCRSRQTPARREVAPAYPARAPALR